MKITISAQTLLAISGVRPKIMTISHVHNFLKAGKHPEALQALQSILQDTPKDPEANLLTAKVLHQLNRREEALGYLEKCVSMADNMSNPARARVTLAQDFRDLEAFDRAEQLLMEARELAPQVMQVTVLLADVMRQQEKNAQALNLYNEVLAVVPNSAELWASAGVAAHHSNQLPEAVRNYKKSLSLDPTAGYIYSNLLAALLELGNSSEALEYCNKWYQQNPKDIEALAFRTLLLVENGKVEEAKPLVDFDLLVQTKEIDAPEGYNDLDEFNRALEAVIRERPNLKTPPEDHPTWHHPALKIGPELNADKSGPIGQLETIMYDAVNEYFAELGKNKDHPFLAQLPDKYDIYAWSAVLEGEGNQHPHIHMDGYLSGCYYVSIPSEISEGGYTEDGRTVGGFEIGRPPMELQIGEKFPVKSVRPHGGLLVLFPAYLYHGTVPFKSSKPRISVAFDVMPVN